MRAPRALPIAIAALLVSCAHVDPQPSFENTQELAEAIRTHGSPMLAGQLGDHESQFVGKTILVEGFLDWMCDGESKADCARSADRFRIFSGDALPAAPGPMRQPCPLTDNGVGKGMMVGGVLPAGAGEPNGRRALLQGTVRKRQVSVPEFTMGGTTVEFVSDFALDDVTVLALYESRCEWPKRP